MKKRVLVLALAILAMIAPARAQNVPQAEVTIVLNEQFFDVLLDAIFKNTNGLEFGISANEPKSKIQRPEPSAEVKQSFVSAFAEDQKPKTENQSQVCSESIRLQRERDGVRTAVRFRDGRITAPIAFTGSYNPPLIGCVDFAGVAETVINLEFDRAKQALVGRAQVVNVNLSGTGGIGGNILARLVQNSIDKKINPIQILTMEKVSFLVPVQNAGNLRMKAVNFKHEVVNGALNVRIVYEFQKAE